MMFREKNIVFRWNTGGRKCSTLRIFSVLKPAKNAENMPAPASVMTEQFQHLCFLLGCKQILPGLVLVLFC